MRKAVTMMFLFSSIIAFPQKKEMAELLKNGNYNKTIELGKRSLETAPEEFETNLMLARAYNEKAEYANATVYIQKSKAVMTLDWEKCWTFIESAISKFGLGNAEEAKAEFRAAQKITATKNAEKRRKEIGLLLGFDTIYTNWKIRKSENIIFHFDNGVSDAEIEKIVSTRQEAFAKINVFFNSKFPKKIDFFVWNQVDNFNPYLNAVLGFSQPKLSISHNRINQTAGHEIAHNISFWKNRENHRTRFINEGIGVCFDQQNNDKWKIAKGIYKTNPVDIKAMWSNQTKPEDTVLYPVAGAFVTYLISYDKEKFLQLAENQTYENAENIYAGEQEELIKGFIKKLKE